MGQEEPKKTIEFRYLLILIRTRRGVGLMERIGGSRFSKPIAWLLLAMVPLLGGLGLFLILAYLSALVVNPVAREAARAIGPLGNLLIPGLNPYLPIFSGWAALVIAVIIHEAGHGIMARSFGIPVKSSGLILLLGLPIGAFVEIDEKELGRAKGRDALRIFAAGPGNNLAMSLVALFLLILLVSSMAPIAVGTGVVEVLKGFPADTAQITPGDVITAVNGQAVRTLQDLEEALGEVVGEGDLSMMIFRDSQLKRVVFEKPKGLPIVFVFRGYPAEEAGLLPGDQIVSIDGKRVRSLEDLALALRDRRPGEEVALKIMRSGEEMEVNLRLARNPRDESLPVLGISVPTTAQATLGLRALPIAQILDQYRQLGSSNPFIYFVPPTLGIAQEMIPFSDLLHVFYTSPLGSLLNPTANFLFWLWFVNVNLAIFNALPIYPLDGGRIFKTFLTSLLGERRMVQILTSLATALVLGFVLLMFIAPYLFR